MALAYGDSYDDGYVDDGWLRLWLLARLMVMARPYTLND